LESTKNICLIGGTGYLGKAFRAQFHAEFDLILNFGRKPVAALNENEEYQDISGMSVRELAEVLREKKVTAVVDFAYSTIPKTSFEHPIADFSENLMLVNKHLEAVRIAGNISYTYISSGGTVYGASKEHPIDEDHQNFPLSPYGITKMAAERYVVMYHHLFAIPIKIVRPSNIYGPGQLPFRGQGFIPTAIAAALTSQPVSVFGDGENIRDYVYISDFCNAIHDILLYGKSGEIYNVGSAEGYSLRSVIQQIAGLTSQDGSEMVINYLPERLFDVRYNVLKHDKLSRLNAWSPKIKFADGLKETAIWIKDFLNQNKSGI
jgi:UDP-glucose 4-epimerase